MLRSTGLGRGLEARMAEWWFRDESWADGDLGFDTRLAVGYINDISNKRRTIMIDGEFSVEGIDCADGNRTQLFSSTTSGEAITFAKRYVQHENAGGWDFIRDECASRLWHWERDGECTQFDGGLWAGWAVDLGGSTRWRVGPLSFPLEGGPGRQALTQRRV